jgi:type IV secretion system protein VirD4
MWIGSMLRAVIRGGLQEKRKVHFVLDEAASLGHMDAVDDAADKGRGYGIKGHFIYQDIAQLKRCFPEGQDQTLLGQTTKIFFGVQDLETAKYVSESLGDATIVVDSGGTSSSTTRQSGEHGHHSYSSSTSQNDNWSQQARPLLKPAEVMALPPRTAITFMPGTPPARTHLLRYYERDFKPGRLSKAFSTFRMFAASAAILFMSMMLALGVASPLFHKKPQPYIVDDPFRGLDQRSFQSR